MGGTQRGAFIIIEGLDRSGKSTQCNCLCAGLENEGHKIKRMRFPGRYRVAEKNTLNSDASLETGQPQSVNPSMLT